MTAKVIINYNKYVNGNIIPSTDFENQMLEEILEWASNHIQNMNELSLPDIIHIYWGWHLGTLHFMEIPPENQENAEIFEFEKNIEKEID